MITIRNFPLSREANINYLIEREDNVNLLNFDKFIGLDLTIMKCHIVTSAMQLLNNCSCQLQGKTTKMSLADLGIRSL